MPRKRQAKSEEGLTEVQINPAALTVAQLKVELGNRGLDTTGKKADLVQRLQEALDTDQPGPSKKVSLVSDITSTYVFSLKRSQNKKEKMKQMLAQTAKVHSVKLPQL